MIEKDPANVIHTVDDLEDYMDRYFQTTRTSFEKWVKRFGETFYLERNMMILEEVDTFDASRVLEFACAGPALAQLLLENVRSIQIYNCSNFSKRMVDYCAAQLFNFPNCTASAIDADVNRSTDMHRKNINEYDMFITTSLEHIQFDRELIGQFPVGAGFVFSVAKFDDPEHFRIYESVSDIELRYADLLEITGSRETADGQKLVVSTVRR